MKGCDYAWAHPSPASLVAAGIGFVMRYLSYDASKNLTAAERDSLLAAGLGVGLVWEAGATDALGGYAQGVTEAQQAKVEAADLGLGSAPVFFAFDFDITDPEKPAGGLYLEGAASVVGADRVGGYGDYDLIVYILQNRLPVSWFWQTTAWSGGLVHPSAHILQTANGATIGGVSVDLDTALKPDFGVTFSIDQGGTSMVTLAQYQEWRDWRLLQGADPAKRPTDIPTTIPSDWWDALKRDIAFGNTEISNATTQLGAEVQSLQQQLSSTQATLTTTQTDLATAQSNLAAAQQTEQTVKGLLVQAEAALP